MINYGTRIVIAIVFLLTGSLIESSYGQSNENFKDYLISYERINFKTSFVYRAVFGLAFGLITGILGEFIAQGFTHNYAMVILGPIPFITDNEKHIELYCQLYKVYF